MKITDDKWNEIIAETRRRIDSWNASATKHNKSDTFRCDLQQTRAHALLMTTRSSGEAELRRHERKAVARELATGELRSVKLIFNKGRLTGFQTKADPKAWVSLLAKPVAEVVRKLKLTDFLMVLSARVVRADSTTYLVHGFHRQDRNRRVSIIVDNNDRGAVSTHQIAEQIVGEEFCFHWSMNIDVLVLASCKNVLFEGDDELYARVPELNPHRRARRERART
jgi:hypothetical protein